MNDLSLTVKLSIHFTLLVLTPLFLVIFISYIYFAQNIEAATKQTIDQFSTLTVESLDQTYNQLSSFVMEMVGDKALWGKRKERESLSSGSEFEQWRITRDIEQIFTTYTSKMDGIVNIGLMLAGGNLYNSNLALGSTIFEKPKEELFHSQWYTDFVRQDQNKTIYPLVTGRVLFLNKLKNIDDFSETIGVMVCELEPKIFEKMFKNTVPSSQTTKYIFNENNEIIYQKGEPIEHRRLMAIDRSPGTKEMKIGSETYLLQRKTSSLTGWSMLEVIPYRIIIRKANELRNASIALVLVCYFLSLLLTILLSRNVVNPLRKIMTKMKNVGRWEDQELLEVNGPVEVRDIAVRFNLMKHEIGQLIEGIREEQRKAKEADMAALQAQINPHFLYNTLNLITFLSRKNKNEEIQILTGSLISFLQNCLKSGEFLVTIATELRMIEHYFLLHQFRMDGNIQLYITVPPDLLGTKIPRFILQPLVENAIFHGLYPKQDTGTLQITVGCDSGNVLTIKIIDDGVGVTAQAAAKHRPTVGLNNMTERLKHFYPDAGTSVNLYSKPGIGTSVIISIPKIAG